jgi:L-histidine N-alpha-methyltransferase
MPSRFHVHLDDAGFLAMLEADVRRGLSARPRWLPPKYFYDETGSRLFERITELPEYYLTRAEEALIQAVAADVVRRGGPQDIVEFGPGSCRKVRWLLDAAERGRDIRYVPVDVGRDGLAHAVDRLARDYPSIRVHAVVADFERHLDFVPPPAGRRLVLFLGSTIGNFEPAASQKLLAELRQILGGDGRLLLGVDLVKDVRTLEAAYNDAAGVTRDFNRNILSVLNSALDGDFRPDAFRHHAFYNVAASRIEMHLIATSAQRVHLRRVGMELEVAAGDGIWTENSYKFTPESVEVLLADAGFALEKWYADEERRFGLALARSSARS